MIASVRGEVLSHGAGWVVLGVGGVGLRVEVPSRLAGAHVGETLTLCTQLVVREDSLTLYGFSSDAELEMFGHLLGVSGVGPRSALGVLSELSPEEVAAAVQSEDERPFRRAPGIGPKTAKLIVVQLAGKIDVTAFAPVDGDSDPSAKSDSYGRVIQALIGLGYGEFQAEEAVRDAVGAQASTDEASLLRAALALLQSPRPGVREATR